jgi:arsenate reductase
MRVTIYHNPQCSNSRGALEIIRAHGIQPTIVEYLKTPPTRAELVGLIARMGVPVG